MERTSSLHPGQPPADSGAPVVFLSEHSLATKTALRFSGEPSYAEWAEVGARLRDIERSIHWWIGDWLLWGEARWGEMYTQAMEMTGYEYGTLATDKWVASRFEFSSRDENLSHKHHRMVADVEDHELRGELLLQARDHSLNAEQLLALKKELVPSSTPPRLISVRARVAAVERVPDEGTVDLVLNLEGVSLSQVEWLLAQLGFEVDATLQRSV